MEDIKVLSKEEFMWVLLLLALFPGEKTNELFKKYATQNAELCYNDTKE